MGEQPWTPISQYCGLACGVWTAVLPLVHGPCLQPPTPQPFDSRGVLVEMSPTQSSWPSISQVAQLVTGPPFCLAFQSPDAEPCISYLKHRGQKKKKVKIIPSLIPFPGIDLAIGCVSKNTACRVPGSWATGAPGGSGSRGLPTPGGHRVPHNHTAWAFSLRQLGIQ